MRVHLVNPSDLSFGTAVITPRWLYVLAAATPARFGTPLIVDETLEPVRPEPGRAGRRRRHRHPHRQRASRIRRRTAGPRTWRLRRVRRHPRHAVPGRSPRTRGARTAWSAAMAISSGREVLADCERGSARTPRTTAGGSRATRSSSARWDLLPENRYMWGSVQTVRGCPKHCSFCSVWRTDGQKPRHAACREVVGEVGALSAQGVPLHPARRRQLLSGRRWPIWRPPSAARTSGSLDTSSRRCANGAIRADGPARAAAGRHGVLHADHDGGGRRSRSSSRRCGARRIRGALVGVESVTPEGLKAVYKNFNDAGEALVTRLQAFRDAGRSRARLVHLRTADRRRRHVRGHGGPGATQRHVVRAVRDAHAVPGHGGLCQMGAAGSDSDDGQRHSADPLLADSAVAAAEGLHARIRRCRPETIRRGTQEVWDRFYSLPAIWQRSTCVRSLRGAPRVRADLEAVSTDVREYRHRHRQRSRRAIGSPRALARQGGAAAVRRRADAGSGRAAGAA